MIRALALLVAGALWLSGCGAPAPSADDGHTPSPALWELTAPSGEQGWLFGTIHALAGGTRWRTPLFDDVLDEAGMLVLEVSELEDRRAMERTFVALASSPGLRPVPARFGPSDAAKVGEALVNAGLADAGTASLETWAVAMRLNGASRPAGKGVDRQIIEAWDDGAVVGLETVRDQLGAFDALPARDQRDLLLSVVEESGTQDRRERMAKAWRSGSLADLEASTREGMLARPVLRQALLVDRNRAWVGRIARFVERGERPLIAVGTAHCLGDDGLVALLGARGFAVRRLQ